ncbi:hypothetical protein CP8484711_0197B, partial [Chlamydia psittaci 84-8471/1]
KFR